MTRLLPEQQLLQQIRTVPALTNAPLELQRLLESEHEVSEVGALVSAEPAMAVCLLRLLARDDDKRLSLTANLQAAVVSAGDEAVRRLASKVQPCDPLDSEQDRARARALWEHSVGVAVLTRELAKRANHPGLSKEVAYSAGLLHNLGAIALQSLEPAKADELTSRVEGKSRAEIRELEQELFGTDRWTFGWMLAELWNLPPSLQDVLLFSTTVHDEGVHCPADTEQLLELIHAAEHIVCHSGHSTLEGMQPWKADEATLALLPESEARAMLEQDLRELSARVLGEMDSPTRTRLLATTGRELARTLRRTEDELYAAQSVASVLRYGLRRLGDGDPVPGLLFRTMEFLGFRRMCHLELDEASQQLTVRQCAVIGSAPRVPEGRAIPISTEAFQRADVVTARSRSAEAQELLSALGVQSCIVTPILSSTKGNLGYISADRGPDGPPVYPGEEEGLDVIAEQAGLLLEYERLTMELQKLATQDPLTGAATRRRLMDRLDFLINQARRAQWPLALILMDLDHFKRFNDTMGHQVGDELLKDLVRVLNANTRKGDLVARYGGEEFVVLLPSADWDGAEAAAENIRAAVFEFGQANAEKYNHTPISISIGLAQLTAEDTSTSLIGRADEALYRAKENGRNRVERAA